MNRSRQAFWRLAVCAAGQLAVFPLFAGNSTNAPAPVKLFSAADVTNAAPQLRSPVELFRQLLAMSPDEREKFLTIYPPETHARILAKVAEYEALDPDERELRLRATELRWYLMPLLRESPTNRDARLAQIPNDMRDLVKSRLEQWIILPPPLQQEFLDDERAMRYFAHVDSADSPPLPEPGWPRGQNNSDASRWNGLSQNERGKIIARVNRFFDLTPEEKQETLNTLSDAERRQMEKTLEAFDRLPPAQRAECIQAFAKFSGMSAPEKEEFLKNAARWSQMSPKERQAWRDLVVNVPEWPPLPSGFVAPSVPPPLPAGVQPVVATNRN